MNVSLLKIRRKSVPGQTQGSVPRHIWVCPGFSFVKCGLRFIILFADVFSRGWGAFFSGEELLSVEMTTAARKVANNVIKYLRWRNSDESGMVAAGFIGVAFVAEPLSTPVEYCEWVHVERGQAGHWLRRRSQCFSANG